MGESDPTIATLPDFAAVRTQPRFKTILAGMATNSRPHTGAVRAFSIPDPGLVPEDIDYDAQRRRFFLTSVLEKKIVTLDAAGRLALFARGPDGWPMLALKIDARRGLVWVTEVALNGFDNVPKRDWGRSAILCYSLGNNALVRRIEGPRKSELGDMALAPNGDALVSDGGGGGVYRVRGSHAAPERIDQGDFISPQTPAYVPGGRQAFVPDYARGIGRVDLDTGRVRWIPMEDRFALEGIDGLYFRDGSLIAVQNGTAPERVVVFGLDATLARVVSERPIQSATASIDPTHGVIVGHAFYYIENSGWNELDDRGNRRPNATLTPARIMRAEL